MAYRKRYFKRRGKYRAKKWGGQPSAKSLQKEVADPGLKDTKRKGFVFRLVAVHLAKDDPRACSKPVSARPFYEDVQQALTSKRNLYASLGHVPLKPRTIVLLVQRSGKKTRAPVLRVYSTASGWKRF